MRAHRKTRIRTLFCGCSLFLLFSESASAAAIVQADVTSALGPDFFIDTAVTGGSDYTVNEAGTSNFDRNLGSLNLGTSGTEVTITGIGWATSSATAANDAETVSVTITYLGSDGGIGGGDDVVMGTEVGTWTHVGAGEYAWDFDADMVAVLDGDGSQFRIAVSPLNAAGNGSLRFKTLSGQGNVGGAKLSVAGVSVAQGDVVMPPVVNNATGSGFWDQVSWDTGSGTTMGDLGDADTALVGEYRTVTYRNMPAGEVVSALRLGENGSRAGQGTLVVDSGTLTVSGTLSVGRNASANDSFVVLNGGVLAVGGDGNFGTSVDSCDGSLTLAGGTVSFGGDLNLGAFLDGGSMLRLHNPGSSPAVVVAGALNLGRCSLDLTFDGSYVHVPGTVVTVATYGSREGQFLNFRDGGEFNCGVNRFRIAYDVGGNAITLTAMENWAASVSRPNVILIFADDQGYSDLSLQGDARYPTPEIDSIAAAGAKFTDAYVSAGVCHPSRCGLLLGRYQQRFGTDNNLSGPSYNGMAVSQATVPRRMQGLGYRTYGIGKWHLGDTVEYHPNNRGFERWYGIWSGSRTYYDAGTSENNVFQDQMTPDFASEGSGYVTDRIGDSAVDFIDEHLNTAPDGQPLFMYVSFTAVHGPMDIQAIDPRFARLQSEFGLTSADYLNSPIRFGQTQATADANRYELAAMTLALDENVGKILDKLAAEGMSNNTLVVYTNDNGGAGFSQGFGGNYSYNTPLRGYKGGSMTDGSIRVPCVAQWPGVIPAGQTISEPLSSLDWGATFVNAAGDAPAAARNGLDGLDLMPLLKDGASLPEDRVICWRASGTQGGGSAIRKGDWKLLIGDPGGTPRLYHLPTDSNENDDKSGEEPELLSELLGRFKSWEARVQAPIYGSSDTVLDVGMERWAISGGLRIRSASSTPVWQSATMRDGLSLATDFDRSFLIRATEGGGYPAAAELWQGLGDSATRGNLIRFGIDYGSGTLSIVEGKTGNSVSVSLPVLPREPAVGVLRYRASTGTLSLVVGETEVQLVLNGSYGLLDVHAMGVAAMEGELTSLRPINRGGSGAEVGGVYDVTSDPFVFDLDFGFEPPWDPGLERSDDMLAFDPDESALWESMGGGRYRVSVPLAEPALSSEFFRYDLGKQ